MIPWNEMPKDLQRAILAMIVVLGGTSASCRLQGPILCDPPPPPSMTPMICDAPPRPMITRRPTPTPTVTRRVSGTAIKTPMICDPIPGPSRTARPTASPTPSGPPSMTPMFCDAPPRPMITRTPMICDPPPPPAHGSDTQKPSEFAAVQTETQPSLPLAELRTVDIVWQGGLTFAADTPWPNARCGWSVSGGTLEQAEGRVTWQPPAEPGRYLLQVVADWGWTGLAVDAVALTVTEGGGVILG